jgi:hypothetical protein
MIVRRIATVALLHQTTSNPLQSRLWADSAVCTLRGGGGEDWTGPKATSSTALWAHNEPTLTTAASTTPTSSMTLSGLTKNFNVYWVAATSLAVWFLGVHAPIFWMQRQLARRDVLLAVHIVAAGTVYAACAHNCLLTPSVSLWRGSTWTCRGLHTWMGRLGMVAGTISFVVGAFLAWSRLGYTGVGGTTLAFSLPITIGGIAQLQAQYSGYTAIRRYQHLKHEIAQKVSTLDSHSTNKTPQEIQDLAIEQRKALRLHIGNMITLFAAACGIPAGIRLAELITGGRGGISTVLAILVMIGVLQALGVWYMAAMKPDMLSRASGPSLLTDKKA